MTAAALPQPTRAENGADSFKQSDLDTLRTHGMQVRALIGRTRGAVRVPMFISLGSHNRPNPCNGFGYGHQDGCPESNVGNVRNQGRNLVRWWTVPAEGQEDGIVQVVGYQV